jgi:thiamine-monophosphate kinase
MNGRPKLITISIALSSKFTIDAIEELYAGIQLACHRHQADIAGGDTTSSLRGMTLNITVIGSVNSERMVKRSSANENDLICVSGDLGSAYLGLQILRREKQVYLQNPKAQPDLKNYEYLIERQLKPEARKDIIQRLEDAGIIPTSMIDISDGLASELMHICTSSKKGCRIYEDKIPIDIQAAEVAEEFNLSPVVCAMSGGEDYELLFTVSQNDYEKLKSVRDITVIGHITAEQSGLFMITRSGSEVAITAQGWDAFRKANSNE